MIPGQVDANGAGLDVFLYSRAARTTVLVSHAAGSATTTANAPSDPTASGEAYADLLLSADGRFLVFLSKATNLLPRQATGSGPSLFLYDRATGTSVLASPSAGSRKPATSPLMEALSADGRFLVFASGGSASLLFDRASGRSTPFAGGLAGRATISADGSQIAFYSAAPNVVPGVRDTNSGEDLFLHSVAQGTDTLVTLHAPGMASVTPGADSVLRGLSADGRWVLFEGTAPDLAGAQIDTNGARDIFLYDHATRRITLVSHKAGAPATAGDGASSGGTMSADGRYVAFTSYATDLDRSVVDAGAGQQRHADVFLFDRATAKVIALSRSARHPGVTGNGDSLRPAISADGRWIAFRSAATDLTRDPATGNVYFYDRVTGALTRTDAAAAAGSDVQPLALSADGRILAYLSPGPGPVFGRPTYLFVLDRVTGARVLASHTQVSLADPAEVSPYESPALSADGRFAAFTSPRPDLGTEPGGDLNVYLFDRASRGVTLLGASFSGVTGAPLPPRHPSLSADGRWITFLVDSATPAVLDQVALHDRDTGTTTLVTASPGSAADPTITPDGRWITFTSAGIDRYDRVSGTVDLIARGSGNSLPSAEGHAVAFESTAPLVPRDFNARQDVYLFTQAP